MLKHIMFLFLLSTSCGFLSKEEPDEDDEDNEQSLHYLHCDSDLRIILPTGEEISGDFCNIGTLEAQYEFDPDTAPEVRSPSLGFLYNERGWC